MIYVIYIPIIHLKSGVFSTFNIISHIVLIYNILLKLFNNTTECLLSSTNDSFFKSNLATIHYFINEFD